MKRSWPNIKIILTIAENTKKGEIPKEKYYLESFKRKLGAEIEFEELLTYNINLLREEGFIIANSTSVDAIGRLTWKGHDLLDEIRGVTAAGAANQ